VETVTVFRVYLERDVTRSSVGCQFGWSWVIHEPDTGSAPKPAATGGSWRKEWLRT